MNQNRVTNTNTGTCTSFSTFLTKQIIIDVIIWCLVCIPVLGLFLLGSPLQLGFYCDDISIRYPYHSDSVSVPVLLAVGLGVPLGAIVFTEVCRALGRSRNENRSLEMWYAAKGFGVFLFGTMITKVFTEVIKFSAGRLRPHFIEVCRPNFSKINCSMGYITEYECLNTDVSDKTMRDSRLSFPSGHSSFASFSAVFVLLYLQYRLVVEFSHLLRPVLQSGVMLLAVWCSVTRVTDNKHFTTDVIAGCVLGGVSAWICFYLLALPNLQPPKIHVTGDNSSFVANSDVESSTPSPLLRKGQNIILIKEPSFRAKSVV